MNKPISKWMCANFESHFPRIVSMLYFDIGKFNIFRQIVLCLLSCRASNSITINIIFFYTTSTIKSNCRLNNEQQQPNISFSMHSSSQQIVLCIWIQFHPCYSDLSDRFCSKLIFICVADVCEDCLHKVIWNVLAIHSTYKKSIQKTCFSRFVPQWAYLLLILSREKKKKCEETHIWQSSSNDANCFKQ